MTVEKIHLFKRSLQIYKHSRCTKLSSISYAFRFTLSLIWDSLLHQFIMNVSLSTSQECRMADMQSLGDFMPRCPRTDNVRALEKMQHAAPRCDADAREMSRAWHADVRRAICLHLTCSPRAYTQKARNTHITHTHTSTQTQHIVGRGASVCVCVCVCVCFACVCVCVCVCFVCVCGMKSEWMHWFCGLLWWCVCLCVCVFGTCSVFCVSGFPVSRLFLFCEFVCCCMLHPRTIGDPSLRYVVAV